MDGRSILMGQIQALAQELGQVAAMLDPNSQRLRDRRLYDRVHVRLENRISQQQQALSTVEQDVDTDKALSDCWRCFGKIQGQCVPLFKECLAFLEGTLVRSAGLDGRLCEIADA